jgi:hypothetical protein
MNASADTYCSPETLRAAETLQHPRQHQLTERVRARAADRAEHEHEDCDEIDAPRAEAVGEPAGGGREHRHGERVGDDDRLHREGRDVQAVGDRRQRGVDDRRVERLHEETGGDDPEQRGVGGILGHLFFTGEAG